MPREIEMQSEADGKNIRKLHTGRPSCGGDLIQQFIEELREQHGRR